MADFVDERTTALLEAHFVTRFQLGKGGKARARSMGDVWLKSAGIFNPINVKSGVSGANGQPNLVSLKKLLRALLADQIDSYYKAQATHVIDQTTLGSIDEPDKD